MDVAETGRLEEKRTAAKTMSQGALETKSPTKRSPKKSSTRIEAPRQKIASDAKKPIKPVKKGEIVKPGTKVASSKAVPSSKQPVKKFQRNTEHTQSLKLFKENFASLFMAKKSTSASSIGNVVEKTEAPNTHLMTDSEILRAIEIETNKNQTNNKKQTENINNSNSSTETNSRFSLLNNRLSAKFSSVSKPKKTSSQPFQFLKMKPPVESQNNKAKEKNPNSSQVIEKKESSSNCATNEEFMDANQVLNSLELPTPQVSARLSFPLSNETDNCQPTNSNRLSTKRLFNFIGGSNKPPSGIFRPSNHHLINQQRRLSDYHRPAKVSNFESITS